MSDGDRLRDLPTAETLPGHMSRLALPVLGEQLLVFGIDLFDVFLAGHIGSAETSAIGLASYVGWMASLIFDLVRIGVAAAVARDWGAGRHGEANRVLARGLWLGVVMSAAVWGLLRWLAPAFAWSMDLHGETERIAVHFLRWDAYGQVCSCLMLIVASALRGTGDTRTPMVVLAFTNLINVLAATGCVYGWGPLPALGVTGIVIGSLVAKAGGLLLMLALVMSHATRLTLDPRNIRWERATALRILRVGTPAALDGMLKFSGHFLFLIVIGQLPPRDLGLTIQAAHYIGIRVEALSYLPAYAWGIASASLAGRLLGATSPDVALRTGHVAVRQFLWYPVVASVAFYFGAEQVFHAMHSDPRVAEMGVSAFRLMALYQVPNALLIIYFNTLIGAGDTRFPMWCTLSCSLGVRVPVAYLCGVVLEGGLFGAWLGMGADNLIRTVLIAWRYHSGKWVTTKV
jgi:MATE family multidrug resistance protein